MYFFVILASFRKVLIETYQPVRKFTGAVCLDMPLLKTFELTASLSHRLWWFEWGRRWSHRRCKVLRNFALTHTVADLTSYRSQIFQNWNLKSQTSNNFDIVMVVSKPRFQKFVKLKYSEKATKFYEISTKYLSYVLPVK